MHVAKVKLENIRGFHDARKVDLELTGAAGWTVIAGPAGSGRSTLLQSIALAIGGPALTTAVVTESAWVSHGRERGGIEVDLVPDAQDAFTRGYAPPADNVFADLVLTPGGVSAESNVGRHGPWQDAPSGWFSAGYGPWRRPGGAARAGSRLSGLFRSDVPLAETGSEAALPLVNDGLLPEAMAARLEGDALWIEAGGHRLAPRELGDTRRALIALVLDLVRHMPSGPEETAGVVLIDEVDAHLDLPWQQRVGGWLCAHFPRMQFIVTTNSPYVCQSAVQGGLVSLAGTPHLVGGDRYDRVVHGSGEDVALSELFGLDSPYAPTAQRLRQELVELELKVLDGQASDVQVARYRELQEMLVSSPTARATEIAARLQRDRARSSNR